jgi:hypothetical protein
MRTYIITRHAFGKPVTEEMVVDSIYQPVEGIYGFRYTNKDGKPAALEIPIHSIFEITVSYEVEK